MRRSLSWLFVILAVPALCAAQSADYERVNPPQDTANPDKIEVLEMFWYGCPHCFRLEPRIKQWLTTKPDDVEYVRLPAIFRPQWELHARVYYTAELLGVLDATHDALFNAIHAERRPLNDEASIADFFAEHGVDRQKFLDTLHSFAVDTKVRRAQLMTNRYGATGVPTIIVNGKYRTDGNLARSYDNIMRVVDRLIEQERMAMKSTDNTTVESASSSNESGR